MSGRPKGAGNTVKAILTVNAWYNVADNRKFAESNTRSVVLRAVRAANPDMRIGASVLMHVEEQVGLKRCRGNAKYANARKDRAVVIARELLAVIQNLGMTASTELLDIAKHK